MINGDKLPPTIMVIFGITGDLSHRYLLPALSKIAEYKKLPEEFKIIGASRRPIDKTRLFGGSTEDLEKYITTLQMDLESPQSYETLKAKLAEISKDFKSQPEIIYYLSVPPAGVLPIIKHLGEAGLNYAQTKLLLEKPFGVDLDSARELITQTAKYFPEAQVYRIDHYLSKEMAQNVVVFLGSNALFRHVWSNKYIEKIVINAAEVIGVEGRANFYESTGALRDFVQSHLLQLAALTLMEPCSGVFEFSELPDRRLAALQSLKPLLDKRLVRGQYAGYQDEVQNPGSLTETFVAMTVESSNPRWSGVPVHLTTGKKLGEKLTEIKVFFKKNDNSEANILNMRIQPREGVELDLWVKQPGYERKLQKLSLQFQYQQHFASLPEAYEQVVIDVLNSNQSLFSSSAEILAAWSILQPIQTKWAMGSNDLITYQPGNTIEEVLRSTR